MVFQNKNGETYHTYTYADTGWSDLLTAFDGGAITYDNIGNPLTYHDGKTFTWTAGRRLASATDGETVITYAYDGDGNRISKTVNGETTEFVYVDGKLLGLQKGQDKLQFLYDETDTAYGFIHNGTPYYYDKNLQGDIIGIYDRNGSRVATYTYDAWGLPEFISDNTLATLNPLRYRGYFYDDETGFYYLQSRYYDPEVGRFINPDGYISTGTGMLGYNMFAYCGNNPVNNFDPSGKAFLSLLTAAAAAICAVVVVCVVSVVTSQIVDALPKNLPAPPSISLPKENKKPKSDSKAKDVAPAIPKDPPKEETVIYRYGGTNPGNLTPSQRDVDQYPKTGKGLSFSTEPRPGAAKTTIEALNATGVVYAVQDGINHVSVHPIGGTLEDWHNAGSGSVWTRAVKSVVIKWDGED